MVLCVEIHVLYLKLIAPQPAGSKCRDLHASPRHSNLLSALSLPVYTPASNVRLVGLHREHHTPHVASNTQKGSPTEVRTHEVQPVTHPTEKRIYQVVKYTTYIRMMQISRPKGS